jgi:hypothetical protein
LAQLTIAALAIVALVAGCSESGRVMKVPGPTRTPPVIRSVGSFDFSSESVTAAGELPQRSGRRYDDIAPAINWGAVPSKTKYLMLVADIPKTDFGTDNDRVLWVVTNIDPAKQAFAEGQAPPGIVVKPWAGPDTEVGFRDNVRFRMWATTKELKSADGTPLQIVLELDKENVGKSEFSVPFAPKAS